MMKTQFMFLKNQSKIREVNRLFIQVRIGFYYGIN